MALQYAITDEARGEIEETEVVSRRRKERFTREQCEAEITRWEARLVKCNELIPQAIEPQI